MAFSRIESFGPIPYRLPHLPDRVFPRFSILPEQLSPAVSLTRNYGDSARSRPTAYPPTNRRHAGTNHGRSSKKRHDAATVPALATPADGSWCQKGRVELWWIHQSTEAACAGDPSKETATRSAAAGGRTVRSAADPAGQVRTAGPHYTWSAGSQGPSACEMDERAGSEDEDMYSERAAKGYVSRFVRPSPSPSPVTRKLPQPSKLNRKSVKRALRALQSPAYAAAASKKNSLLPPVTPEQPIQEIFKLLPLSLLALRVSKADPHEGHDHGPSTSKKPQKRVKGLWHVKIEPQQDIDEDLHYIWLYEGPQWKQKLYAAGALAAIMAVVMFPLWPIKLRLGVWYLSMGVLGLIGLFTLMSIFRLILFCITYFAVPPGLWLYPNLFEDVGFFDSFKPLWGWQEVRSLSLPPSPNLSSTISFLPLLCIR